MENKTHIFESEVKLNCFSVLGKLQSNPLVVSKLNANFRAALMLDKAKRAYADQSYRECEEYLTALIESL